MPPGQFAFQLMAYDLDNDPLTYQIGGTDAFYFSANSTSGRVTLRNSLDREVWAEDGVRCPCLSGGMGMEGRACGSLPDPKTQLLEGELSSQRLRVSSPRTELHLGPDQVLPCAPSGPGQAHHHHHSV